MALMDAPQYDEKKAVRRRNLLIGSGVLVVVLIGLALAGFFSGHGWLFMNVPAEHRVSKFLTAVENKDFNRAFAIWNNDDAWQQHPEKFKDYNFGRFQVDWSESSDFGVIRSHKIVCSLASGSGVAVGVDINGRKQTTFIWVQNHTHTLGFSPVEVEC
jgi:hypothetical protein